MVSVGTCVNTVRRIAILMWFHPVYILDYRIAATIAANQKQAINRSLIMGTEVLKDSNLDLMYKE